MTSFAFDEQAEDEPPDVKAVKGCVKAQLLLVILSNGVFHAHVSICSWDVVHLEVVIVALLSDQHRLGSIASLLAIRASSFFLRKGLMLHEQGVSCTDFSQEYGYLKVIY